MAEQLHLRDFQDAAAERALNQDALMVLADPGLGKTVIALETFRRAREWCDVSSMLVVAPLRVCFSVWPREVARWDRYADLRVQVLHGPTRTKDHLRGADVYVINGDLDALTWLGQQKWQWPEMVVADESHRFKRKSSQRSGALRRMMPRFRRRLFLTGTPASNGLENLHGQAHLLDGGRALFPNVGQFRERWMVPVPRGDKGFIKWELRDDAAAEIYQRMAPLCVRLDAADHLDLPALVEVEVPVELPPDARALYDRLDADLTAQVGPGWVDAPNAGVLSAKLRQVANGPVYLSPSGGVAEGPTRQAHVVHRAKAEALAGLVDELQGKPLLVAYEHHHELALIREELGWKVPAIAGRVSAAEGARIEVAWNAGQLPVLALQWQSGSLGLNLQAGGHHVAVFADTYNPDDYFQLIRRVLRQGQKAAHVLVYHLRAMDTVDQRIAKRRGERHEEERDFLNALPRA